MSTRPPTPAPADELAPPPIDTRPTDAHPASPSGLGDDVSLVVEEPRFALVPEWVIDAVIPDSSFRLYSLLLRYGGTSGQRMPSRTTLARRMRRSVDAVDRAMRELVAAGIVRVEHRRSGQQYLSNRYHVRTSGPLPLEEPSRGGRTSAATSARDSSPRRGGRADAATGDRTDAATPGRGSAVTPGRAGAGRVAADVRHDPEPSTQSTPPPPASPAARSSAALSARSAAAAGVGRGEVVVDEDLLIACGVVNIAELSTRCMAARRALGLSATRWASHCLAAALHLAVRGRGWPAELAVPALLAVAADPASQSPMRLAEAGPWWDQVTAPDSTGSAGGAVAGWAVAGAASAEELAICEQRLAELGGQRPRLQAQARAELAREGMPVTRSTVVRRACEILDRRAAG
ncbi:helix-turn-helix domain-containing protein [Kineococcus glutinatus]|uniref:Helix-turn-helix protein n=1 Tax=Kineococcus glutinatus TaxID=1070872 RepID=A0ABP9HKQ9_9ACTN